MYKLRIDNIINQPGDNITLQLQPVEGDYPTYLAGQFISLIFEGKNKEVRRSYSLNSSPDLNEPLSITVKRVENGEISRLLHHKTSVGDVLLAQEPQGLFTYLPEKYLKRNVFLFAAGVGITPLFSILKTALIREENSKITLVYSNRALDSTLFYDELIEWQNKYPERLKIIFVFSNSKNLLTARLNKFYIEKILKEHLIYERDEALFYSCGPIIYMDLCRITLLGMGFDIKQIKRETFVLPEDEVDEDDSSEKVVDKNAYSVVLNFEGQVYNLDVPWPKRILDVALEHKIKLPYSCRGGVCSTCVANCTKGGVKMDYNEVLTDDEIERGRVLVCTGHPTENGTTIEW
ncbi:2Fe-2S iron-sulfur cluster-binding protein [Pedobacter jejuensis]|uniref:Phenylacetic acid degradation protein n=1 Tax=Pedobacter jejuensis TaxID=1268550 RepID=A0A3N0BYS0_9SPHI|nr:2Fe-2S iron-sulfur cluster-binding protein [Pedobacter jejuensis]RNL54702.1 phenylacetic acid degradation protein [Pedobacter jejuensis]